MNILISIKPQYVYSILTKTKGVEFRKKFTNKEIDRCYIYSSSPQKRIVGYFTIKFIDVDTPQCLWEKYHLIGGINKEDFFKYYDGKDKGYCLIFDSVIKFKIPLDPQNIIPNFTPPQSYCYIHAQID